MKMSCFTLVLVFAAQLSGIAAEEVTFVKGPKARRAGDKVRIDFEVSRPTDVALYVTDKGGRVVRRLAAGLLGTNAPAPFKSGSLSQSIEWDMKDDAGGPAPGDEFRVRVGAGMRAAYADTAFGWTIPKRRAGADVVLDAGAQRFAGRYEVSAIWPIYPRSVLRTEMSLLRFQYVCGPWRMARANGSGAVRGGRGRRG